MRTRMGRYRTWCYTGGAAGAAAAVGSGPEPGGWTRSDARTRRSRAGTAGRAGAGGPDSGGTERTLGGGAVDDRPHRDGRPGLDPDGAPAGAGAAARPGRPDGDRAA